MQTGELQSQALNIEKLREKNSRSKVSQNQAEKQNESKSSWEVWRSKRLSEKDVRKKKEIKSYFWETNVNSEGNEIRGRGKQYYIIFFTSGGHSNFIPTDDREIFTFSPFSEGRIL